jgi:hypothetical protein
MTYLIYLKNLFISKTITKNKSFSFCLLKRVKFEEQTDFATSTKILFDEMNLYEELRTIIKTL